jgi:hypothetical protein
VEVNGIRHSQELLVEPIRIWKDSEVHSREESILVLIGYIICKLMSLAVFRAHSVGEGHGREKDRQ